MAVAVHRFHFWRSSACLPRSFLQFFCFTPCSTIARYPTKVSILITWQLRFFYLTQVAGGLVLWSRSFTPTAAQAVSNPATSPVNSLIREVLIEGRSGEDKYEKDGYAIRWTFVNELELIFVVCFSSYVCVICLNLARFLRLRTSASYNSHMWKICWQLSRHFS